MAKKKKTVNENVNGEEKPSRPAASTAARKKPARTRSTPKPKVSTASVTEPTDDEIQLRAYFIAERRHRLNLPGNADSDWLEARRQLAAELGSR